MATTPEVLTQANPIPMVETKGLILRLQVTDPEVTSELLKHAEGVDRETFALGALRLGVITLRQATGHLDSAAVREAGQELIAKLSQVLAERGGDIANQIGGSLRQYFDPATGALPQRIESLIRGDGELERALRVHLAPENSTIARTLAGHLGSGSPLFKLLSPDDAEGLKCQIEAMLTTVLEGQQERFLHEFSLDTDDSALSRLIRKVRESSGELATDVKEQVESLTAEFSLDKPDSALSRLVKKVESAQDLIGKSLTLDDEGSSLSRLKRELKTTIEGLSDSNTKFQSEVRESLAKLQTYRETAAQSTLHGLAFEDQLGHVLDAEASRLNDIHEKTGATTGAISHCKTGDFVTTLGADSAASGARIVWEAKGRQGYDVAAALKEIAEARKNRQAQVGVFVFAKEAAPETMESFGRYGNDLIVIWNSEDVSADLFVKAAYSVARALVIREAQESAESEEALNEIELSTREIEKQIDNLTQIKTWAETVKSNGEKIADRAGRMHTVLLKAVEELDRQIAGLKTKAS